MKNIIFVCLALISLINPSFAQDKPHHWTYDEVKEWGETHEFETCKLGKAQSPINIVKKEAKKSANKPSKNEDKKSSKKVVSPKKEVGRGKSEKTVFFNPCTTILLKMSVIRDINA